MKLREALRMLRKELDLTQTDLANLLNVNFSTVNRWENGKSIPNRGTAVYLLQYAIDHKVSQICQKQLKEALLEARREELNFSDSGLYEIERETVCQLVDDADNGVYVSDMETDELLYVNHMAEKYAGKAYVHGLGQKCYEYFFHLKKPCSFCPKEYLIANQYSKIHLVPPKSGRTLRFTGRVLDWNGRKAHVQYFSDETYAIEAQNGLKQLLDRLDAGVSIGYVYDDGRMELSYLNDGYYAMLGSSREKRMKYSRFSVLNVVHPEDLPHLKKEIWTASQEERDFSVAYRSLMDDGQYRWLNITGAFIEREEVRSMFYCAFMDVDHLKK